MEKKNNSLRRAVSSSVLFGFLAILLCAPNVRADLVVPDGQTENIDYAVGDYLEIYGTANLYTGASALFDIFAYPGKAADDPGSTVNIYGCAPGNTLTVLRKGDIGGRIGLPPVVTIFGSRFEDGAGASYAPPDDQVINGILKVYDESDNDLFSFTIYSDIDIHLRAPGSEEEEKKERLEADLCISPKIMYRHRSRPVVFATLCLPEGVTSDDIDSDCPLWLSCEKNEIATKACYKRMCHFRRRENARVKIFAFFNIANLLECASDDCEEMQLQVCGRLQTGQEFYGSDTIKIINPHKRHRRGQESMIKKYRHR